jgi:hypothetical protein
MIDWFDGKEDIEALSKTCLRAAFVAENQLQLVG